MNTNEASIKFKIDVKEIRKRIKEGMVIDAYKLGGNYVIPETTLIIPSKQNIQAFLLQIIKYKNNNNIAISRENCYTEEQLKIVLDFLYKKGLIASYEFDENVDKLFKTIKLTDSGFAFVLGNSNYKKICEAKGCSMGFQPNINIFKVG